MHFKFVSRGKIALVFAVLILAFPAFFASTVGTAQTRSQRKPAPTPKKKTTPTPKRAKATPTPKKNQAKTAPKTAAKTPAKNSNTKKAPAKSVTSKTGDKNRNSKTSTKTSKTDKNASKSKTNSKTAKTPAKSPAKTATKTAVRPAEKRPPVKTAKKDTPTVVPSNAPEIIVTTFSVPVRGESRSSAPTLSRIPIGTVLKVAGKNAGWYKIVYPSGGRSAAGWIPASAVNDVGAADKTQIYRQIVDRSYRPDMDFASAAELLRFMDGISGQLDRSDTSGELELKRLLVLRSALKQIASDTMEVSPYRDFLKSHDAAIVYSEPSGTYLVTANQFWDLHTKYAKSVISDSIAWEAAQNQLPGECEGYVNCHLFDLRMRFGEYLNHHPSGKYSAEALTNVTNYLDPIVADSNRKEVYNGPTDVTDRAEFNNLIAELRTIVARLGFVEKERTLQQLRQIAEAYR